MNIGDTLALLRKDKGISQSDVAEYCAKYGRPVTRKAISKWEQGSSFPDAEQFLILCRLYEVSDVLSVFLGGREGDSSRLNSRGKEKLVDFLRILQSSPLYSLQPAVATQRQIPLYDISVSAGPGQFLDSDRYEMIDVDDEVFKTVSFAVKIAGDSMSPKYNDGQIIYVRQQQNIEPGECGIFVLNGSAYCKEFRFVNAPELISLNSKYNPIKIGELDDFRVVGKVVG